MALVTHPIYAKEWSFTSSPTATFDAPPPYSMTESGSHVQTSAVQTSHKRRAQDLELEWDEEGRRSSTWSHATTNVSKKAKRSEQEDVNSKEKDVTVPAGLTDSLGCSLVSASVAPKMERVLMFLVDALTNVCTPTPNASSSSFPSPSSPLLLPAPAPSAPLNSEAEDPSKSGHDTVLSAEESENQDVVSSPILPPREQARVRPLKSLASPTSPLSDVEDRAPYVRKTFPVREACAGRTEQKLGRWVLAKNHFLSIRCLDPRTQSVEWQQSLRTIGWEPLHPYFQAQAEAELEAASSRQYDALSEWIEDDFDADFETDCGVEGDEDWSDEDEEDGEFVLPRQSCFNGPHTDVWDSGVSLTLTPVGRPRQELSLDDCRC